jgi:hypothetical protein
MLQTLAPIVGWLGLGGTITAASLGAAYFFPLFRRLALEIAAIAAVATFLYGKGIHDGTAFKQAEWDAAVAAAVEHGKADRGAAERDIDRGLRDPYDRDDN